MKTELYKYAQRMIKENNLKSGDQFKIRNKQFKTEYLFAVDDKGYAELILTSIVF